jgi:hypothetical protein
MSGRVYFFDFSLSISFVRLFVCLFIRLFVCSFFRLFVFVVFSLFHIHPLGSIPISALRHITDIESFNQQQFKIKLHSHLSHFITLLLLFNQQQFKTKLTSFSFHYVVVTDLLFFISNLRAVLVGNSH